MHELRRHRRLKVPLRIEIRHPAIGKLEVAASDMSDSGVFLLMDECFQLDIGESVIVRTLGLGPNGDEAGAPLVMEVARKTKDGMGLRIEESASANLNSFGSEQFASREIIQSLLIFTEKNQIFLIQKGHNWQLPSRLLSIDETWQHGISAQIESLKLSRLLPRDTQLHSQLQCFPNSETTDYTVELLVPCLLESEQASTDDADTVGSRWVNSTEIPFLAPDLNSKLVDKALKQARH